MKYRVKKYALSIFVLLLLTTTAKADLISQNYGSSEGLISNTVRCIFEDADSRVWVGTDGGISIFNGYNFTPITSQDGLAGNEVWDIIKDPNGGKWIACYGAGLTHLQNGKYTNYAKEKGLENVYVRTLFSLKGQLLIGTNNGLFAYQASQDSIISVPFPNEYQSIIQINQIVKIHQTIFVVTNEGLFQYSPKDTLISYVATLHSHLYHLVPLPNDSILYSSNGRVFVSKKMNISSYYLGKMIIHDFVRLNDQRSIIAVSNGTQAGGGVYSYKNGKLQNLNEKFEIQSTKIWTCKLLSNGLLAVGSLDDGLYLVNTHLSSFQKYDIENIQGQFTFNKKDVFYTKTQLISKDNRVLFSLDLRKIIAFYKKEGMQPEDLDQFNLQQKTQHIHHIQAGKDHLFMSTSSGLIVLSKAYQIQHVFPVKIDKFFVWDSTLVFEQPNNTLIVYPSIFGKNKDSSYRLSLEHQDQILHYQLLQKRLIIWTANNGVYSFSKNTHAIKRITTRDFGAIKRVNTWKNWFILVTKENIVFKGSISNDIIHEAAINTHVHFNNILSGSTNGDNFILQTDKGLIVYLVGTIRLFNRFNFLNHMKVTTAEIKGTNLFIYTREKVYSFQLHQLLGYYLAPPKVLVDPLENKVIPYSQKGMSIGVENIATQLPENFEYFYSVNGGDTVPIQGRRIYLMNLSSGKFDINILIYNNYNVSWKNAATISFTKRLPIWTQWFFWLVLVFLLISILLVIYLRRKLKQRHREMRQKEIEQRISSLRLEAIRAKMNPHFMFNALNSIQNYVIDNDVDNALLYLAEFSKLMRQTLDYSSMEKITILDEIDFLERYIRIERMRFTCNIKIIKEIDESLYNEEIPPMILQPLIENAFVHGMDNETLKTQEILIQIERKSPNIIQLRISNSKERDTARKREHQSFALQAIRERLTLNHPQNSMTITNDDKKYAVIISFVLSNKQQGFSDK